MRRTDDEVMDLLRGDSVLNKARQVFSGAAVSIEQAGQQRGGLPPIEMRRLEFEAVDRIAAALSTGKST